MDECDCFQFRIRKIIEFGSGEGRGWMRLRRGSCDERWFVEGVRGEKVEDELNRISKCQEWRRSRRADRSAPKYEIAVWSSAPGWLGFANASSDLVRQDCGGAKLSAARGWVPRRGF